MAGIGDYSKGKKFTLKSGNKTSFKMMGSSPLKQGPQHDPKKNPEATAHPDDATPIELTTSEKLNILTDRAKNLIKDNPGLALSLAGPAASATVPVVQAVKELTKPFSDKPEDDPKSKKITPPKKQETKKMTKTSRPAPRLKKLEGKQPTTISHNLPEKDIVKKRTLTSTTAKTKKRRKRKNK